MNAPIREIEKIINDLMEQASCLPFFCPTCTLILYKILLRVRVWDRLRTILELFGLKKKYLNCLK